MHPGGEVAGCCWMQQGTRGQGITSSLSILIFRDRHIRSYRWMIIEDSRPVHLPGGLQWQVELASDGLYFMCLWVDDSLSV